MATGPPNLTYHGTALQEEKTKFVRQVCRLVRRVPLPFMGMCRQQLRPPRRIACRVWRSIPTTSKQPNDKFVYGLKEADTSAEADRKAGSQKSYVLLYSLVAKYAARYPLL
jgi:hypothetical protein